MFKDIINHQSLTLSVSSNIEATTILSFIDKVISGFKNYYIKQSQHNPLKENRISDLLVHYFQCHKLKFFDGFCPFDFRKNPTQLASFKETDIGVYPISLNSYPLLPIFEFEAKRLSNSTAHNSEYVYGKRGGIERFKRGQHSPHLLECGMFGYIQSDNADYWIPKINHWIQKAPAQPDIDWTDPNESLRLVDRFTHVVKLKSDNYRYTHKNTIRLWHYMIDLTEIQ